MATSTIKSDGYETALINTGNYIPTTGWDIKRVGSTVFLFLTNLSSAPAGAFNTGGAVIPASMRPKPFVNKTIQPRTATARPPIAVSVNSDGSISFYNYGGAFTGTVGINETLSWPTI